MMTKDFKNLKRRDTTEICKKIREFCEKEDITICSCYVKDFWDGGDYSLNYASYLRYTSPLDVVK